MEMKELSYNELMEIDGGKRNRARRGRGSWGCECNRDWDRIAKGTIELGYGIDRKTQSTKEDNALRGEIISRAGDYHIDRGISRIKEGWRGGCTRSEYREFNKWRGGK
ncbi:MAG: hypothetical protein Q4D53_03605 [Leptotrichiaceae bacterium]|nr:hypothetical protein [Leptotrichiaceae bacterium]